MTTFTLTALAFIGLSAARAMAGRPAPRTLDEPDEIDGGAEPLGREPSHCRFAPRRHRPRLRIREGRRAGCR
jgi:hypothetical protein